MDISTKNLAEVIDGLLLEAKIYDVDAYGWRNEDEHDPDFVG